VVLALGLLVAALYSDWTTEWMLGSDDPSHGYISELGAAGQPHAQLFGALDVTAGALAAVLGLLLWRRGTRAGGVAVAVFGLALVCSGSFPMDCAPSLSRACARSEALGRTSWREDVHTVASVVECTALIAAMAVVSWQRRGRVAFRTWVVASPLVAGLALYVAYRAEEHRLVGWSERGLATFFALFLVTLAVDARRVSAPAERGNGARAPRARRARRGAPAGGALGSPAPHARGS
jgi:hypothetical protein